VNERATLHGMMRRGRLEDRVAALEATVRELRDQLDRVVSHLTVAQDEDVARVLARHPDMRKHLPPLG
jgi:hypothetical protein